MKTEIEKLEECLQVQTSEGNWNYDPYMFGMANGMILSLAIMKGEEPKYLNRPDVFISEQPEKVEQPNYSGNSNSSNGNGKSFHEAVNKFRNENPDIVEEMKSWTSTPIVEEQREEKHSCNLSDSELLERCDEWVDKLCKTGGKAWTLSVPVNFHRDPDMLFTELNKRYKQSLSPSSTAPQPSEEEQLKTVFKELLELNLQYLPNATRKEKETLRANWLERARLI